MHRVLSGYSHAIVQGYPAYPSIVTCEHVLVDIDVAVIRHASEF